MKRDDVIRMAQQWGDWNGETVEFNDVGLERFAALVAAAKEQELLANIRHHIVQAEERGAAAEREACAQVCEEWGATTNMEQGRLAGNKCAAAIRARGNT